jgi:hypothetical protein
MSLFKLSPRDGRSPNWQRSGYVGVIIVRASSDVSAREIAERAFSQIVDSKGIHGRMLHSPWLDAREVSCVRAEPINGVEEEGPEGVVFPPSAVELARRGD